MNRHLTNLGAIWRKSLALYPAVFKSTFVVVSLLTLLDTICQFFGKDSLSQFLMYMISIFSEAYLISAIYTIAHHREQDDIKLLKYAYNRLPRLVGCTLLTMAIGFAISIPLILLGIILYNIGEHFPLFMELSFIVLGVLALLIFCILNCLVFQVFALITLQKMKVIDAFALSYQTVKKQLPLCLFLELIAYTPFSLPLLAIVIGYFMGFFDLTHIFLIVKSLTTLPIRLMLMIPVVVILTFLTPFINILFVQLYMFLFEKTHPEGSQ